MDAGWAVVHVVCSDEMMSDLKRTDAVADEPSIDVHRVLNPNLCRTFDEPSMKACSDRLVMD